MPHTRVATIKALRLSVSAEAGMSSVGESGEGGSDARARTWPACRTP